ncbi:hypothetical protein EJ04DRAFT_125049 [Polyplosphaeria fusca]|uniref:Uncharacterized protein n=1 Tax=Polyplosphaeria fusca TaxID=682080 RepID=A0A9P4R163_9PLEO|nr:hypothetical protein EJ04DRAFT_125049 [Polyplosphaeria fusca]
MIGRIRAIQLAMPCPLSATTIILVLHCGWSRGVCTRLITWRGLLLFPSATSLQACPCLSKVNHIISLSIRPQSAVSCIPSTWRSRRRS